MKTSTAGDGRRCGPGGRPSVAIAHDQLVQRGGAERVALLMVEAFPGAALFTSLYDPYRTFPEFRRVDVRTSPLDRVTWLRGHVRVALPLMAPAFSAMHPSSSVTVCSSTGWSHGARVSGRKIVYCHAPARWLYQPRRYLGAPARGPTPLGDGASSGARKGNARPGRSSIWSSAARLAMWGLGPSLRRWDQQAAQTAHRYLANSTATAAAVRAIYGIEAEVLAPPPAVVPGGQERAVAGLEPGFWLCVSRLLPYKNVDAVAEAVRLRPGERLVVVGEGPQRGSLERQAGRQVQFLGTVVDEELRWLYRNCRGLLSASYEDFGLTPLEAASFGRPSVVLRWGGFVDTLREGETGVFFDEPVPEAITAAIDRLEALDVRSDLLVAHAEHFGRERFITRLRQIVDEEFEYVR
jgi:glycosyltransferase involved in cell wall biosynthesis